VGLKTNAGGVATAVISVLKLVMNIHRIGKNISKATVQPAIATPHRLLPVALGAIFFSRGEEKICHRAHRDHREKYFC
jgi:hypothetical protein